MASKKTASKASGRKDLPAPLVLDLKPLAPDVVTTSSVHTAAIDFGDFIDIKSLSIYEVERLTATVKLLQVAIATVAAAAQPVPTPPTPGSQVPDTKKVSRPVPTPAPAPTEKASKTPKKKKR